eukprot:Hpha_TRINITY_DN360_c0_g1::TRINITY_DN360_c0_g1_i1::g.112676::m.112676/K06173/truA, PUS1; tRNA pseudouridine38-40 synthase
MTKCEMCGEGFESRNQLFSHIRSVHGVISAPPGSVQKCVLVTAYLGSSYAGSQRNSVDDAVPTIEGVLWRAIGKVLPDPSWYSELTTSTTHPAGLTRSSRTDRGVHALQNIISLRLPLLSTSVAAEASFVAGVNAALPDDVRLLRLLRVPMAFDARRCCERRRYHYLVPISALRAVGAQEDEEKQALLQRLKKVLKVLSGGSHNMRRFTRPAFVPESEGGGEIDYKRQLFRCFCSGVLSLQVGGEGGNEPTPFAVLSIAAPSFLYHQIRKMVGSVIGVMRGSLDKDFIERALKPDRKRKEDEE